MPLVSGGVFSKQDIFRLLEAGRIIPCEGFKSGHVQPASLDLTVSGPSVFELDVGFKPNSVTQTVQELVESFCKPLRVVNLGEVLYPGRTYLAKASADLNFPPGMYAYANAKSTSGRNFLLVRVIADYCTDFDSIDHRDKGYKGNVWFLMQPLVYPIILTDKEAYIQMRIFDQDTRFSEQDLRRHLQTENFFFDHNDRPYDQDKIRTSPGVGSLLSTLWAREGKIIGFKAVCKDIGSPLDLTRRDVDPSRYFEPVYAQADPSNEEGGLVILEPNSYYLLSTEQRFKVPRTLSAELQMLDPRIGLFFSHFAGFFDPGFFGTPTLEVFSMVRTALRHGDVVGRFGLEYMRSETDSYNKTGNYGEQRRTTLPKQFIMPDSWHKEMF
jgi:dCTP deaminase